LNAHDEQALNHYQEFLINRGWTDIEVGNPKWKGRAVPSKYLPSPDTLHDINKIGLWKPATTTEANLKRFYKNNPKRFMWDWHRLALHKIYTNDPNGNEKSIGYYKGILKSIKGITLALMDYEELIGEQHEAIRFDNGRQIATITDYLKKNIYLATKKLIKKCGRKIGAETTAFIDTCASIKRCTPVRRKTPQLVAARGLTPSIDGWLCSDCIMAY